ncbi:MAG: hypothetical protein ABI123_05305 [Ginsengibacter sp.]|jgi:hypothetical protein
MENKNLSDKEKIANNQKPDEHVEDAFREAERDINRDASMKTPPEEQSDLDEGELARKEGHP